MSLLSTAARTVADWMKLGFPEGLVEYLEQANRAERPNAATRSWALLDFL
jgi:hypothetical protein